MRLLVGLACCASLIASVAPAAELEVGETAIAAERERLSDAAFTTWLERQTRLTRVDTRLRAANAAACGAATEPITGIVARAAEDLPRAFRDVAFERLGVDDLLTVLAAAPGHAGAAAGVRPGDAILSVNGVEVHSMRALVAAAIGPTLTLRVARGDRILDLPMPFELGCAFPAELLIFDTIDVRSQDDHIAVTAGAMRFVASDDELALLLAHELAHRLRDGGLRGDADEIGADRLGLELAARAGFAVDGAAALSQRIEMHFPLRPEERDGYAHPVSDARWNALREAAP